MTYPKTALDHSNRDLALALIAERPGISGSVHLLAMIMGTQNDMMQRYLSDTGLDRHNLLLNARRFFVVPYGQQINFSELLDHLVTIEAVTITYQGEECHFHTGRTFYQTTRTHPETANALAQLALEAVDAFQTRNNRAQREHE